MSTKLPLLKNIYKNFTICFLKYKRILLETYFALLCLSAGTVVDITV
jgi:hypothetical protein